MPKANTAILILAAGTGQRMNEQKPKQFLELNGQSILFHTINNIVAWNYAMDIYIVTREEYKPMIKDMLDVSFLDKNIQIVLGGQERFDSTQHALEQIPDYEFILIHDAARPFVSEDVIKKGMHSLKYHDVIIPVIPVVDSIRHISEGKSKSLSRNDLRAIQTPQFFNGSKLKQVFSTIKFQPVFTDDASVMEYAGHEIFLIDGNPENIKITYPMDLAIAEYILQHQ